MISWGWEQHESWKVLVFQGDTKHKLNQSSKKMINLEFCQDYKFLCTRIVTNVKTIPYQTSYQNVKVPRRALCPCR